MNLFIEERLNSNKTNFWDPIPNLKIGTFATNIKTKSIRGTNDKLLTVIADRDLFGRLLIAANSREINIKDLLSYELSAVPFSLSYQDGTLRKTTKSVLTNLLEEQADAIHRLQPSELNSVYIIDGMAIIQMMKSAGATTFGEMAMKFFNTCTAPLLDDNCFQVHLVFDQYWDTSIKGGERDSRGKSNSLVIHILGPSTPTPKQWSKYISNPVNKVNLADFLTSEMCKIGNEKLPVHKKLIIGGGFKDGERAVCITQETCEDIEELSSDHEEADTRMLLHAKYASTPETRIIIQSPDTDVLVLCITHCDEMSSEELWFRTGVKDRLRYIPVHTICQRLGRKMCQALPAFHALTGCDTNSSIVGVSKKKAWTVLQHSDVHQQSLGMVGQEPVLDENCRIGCERFICSLYPSVKKPASSADELRYQMFCQKRHKNELLPPTSDSTYLHSKRANYQAYIWRMALTARQDLPLPEANGWKKVDDTLRPHYMKKDPAPNCLLELTTCRCGVSECQRNCSCANIGLSCTESCSCMGDSDSCRNPHGKTFSDSDDEGDGNDNGEDDDESS